LKIASESLKGRVFEASLADLSKNEDDSYRKIKLRCEEVEGTNCLTTFYGMDLVRHKIGSLIKKHQSLIEANVDVKTTDGFTLRLFCIGFTKKRPNSVRKTFYAGAGQVKKIRAKMVEIMTSEATKSDLRELTLKLIPEMIGKEIEKACQCIYPLQSCYVRKVKLLSSPKFDLQRLLELHEGGSSEEVGAKVDRADPAVEPTSLAGSGGRL
jgi:small subunit ribosomal protein S3Ae